MNELVPFTRFAVPTLVAAAGKRAGPRFLEFFTANIRNAHTRRAYAQAAREFLGWCGRPGRFRNGLLVRRELHPRTP